MLDLLRLAMLVAVAWVAVRALVPGPDPGTILGHLETCPFCEPEDSNPVRCGQAMRVSRGGR